MHEENVFNTMARGISMEMFDLVVISLKELQETGLSASGPLDPAETQVVAGPLQVPHVHGQVLQPQARSLTDRGQLGRPAGGKGCGEVGGYVRGEEKERTDSLVVREAKRGEVRILLGKIRQSVNDSCQLPKKKRTILHVN